MRLSAFTPFLKSAATQSILYAGITKSVGSVFRVTDDWEASPGVMKNTLRRESILLGLTTIFTTGIQMLFTKGLGGYLRRHPAVARYELLLRMIATAPALFFAETASRVIAPRNIWTKPPNAPTGNGSPFGNLSALNAPSFAAFEISRRLTTALRPVVEANNPFVRQPVQRPCAGSAPAAAIASSPVHRPQENDHDDDDD